MQVARYLLICEHSYETSHIEPPMHQCRLEKFYQANPRGLKSAAGEASASVTGTGCQDPGLVGGLDSQRTGEQERRLPVSPGSSQ